MSSNSRHYRIKGKHGGKREGAGRKPHTPPLKRRCVTLTDAQAALVRMYGRGDLSAGLRWLIDASKSLIRRISSD